MTTMLVKLGQLRRDDTINSRTAEEEQGLDELIASIRADGILQPLLVRSGDEPGTFKIIDGHRRFRAASQIEGFSDVPVHVREVDDGNARSMSLATNILRLPLHPVDQFKAFAALVDEGLPREEIAARFGVAGKTVDQRLALGKVAPEILAAYRADKMKVEAVTLFAGAGVERQRKAWAVIEPKGYVNIWDIKQALGEGTVHPQMQEFVGREVYLAAGGRLEQDLFSGAEVWLDPDKALVLASEKLKEVIARYQAEGWAFVKHETDMPENWQNGYWLETGEEIPTPEQQKRLDEIRFRMDEIEKIDSDQISEEEEAKLTLEFQQLEDEMDAIQVEIPEVYTDEQKKVCGIVIRKDWSIEVRRDRKAKAGETAAEPEAAKPKTDKKEWSEAVKADLMVTGTIALQHAIARDTTAAQSMLIASMYLDAISTATEKPLATSAGGELFRLESSFAKEFDQQVKLIMKGKSKTFVDAYHEVLALSTGQRDFLLALLTARRMKTASEKMLPQLAAILSDTIDIDAEFRPDTEFFGRLTTAHLVDVIKECTGKNLTGMTKQETVRKAVEAAASKQWLPKVLRPLRAAQPKEAEAKPAKKKKAA
jgi:ParB/RepB/Spo0J family partition protein